MNDRLGIHTSKVNGTVAEHGCAGWIYIKNGFVFFSLYGSWEPLDTQKILPRGVGTFSTPGQAIPRIFQKTTFYIFSKTVDPQNVRSSISPYSRVWGGGTHPVLSAIPWSYWHFSNTSLTRWDEKFVFSISVAQPRQKARNLSATKIGARVHSFVFPRKAHFWKDSVYYR